MIFTHTFENHFNRVLSTLSWIWDQFVTKKSACILKFLKRWGETLTPFLLSGRYYLPSYTKRSKNKVPCKVFLDWCAILQRNVIFDALTVNQNLHTLKNIFPNVNKDLGKPCNSTKFVWSLIAFLCTNSSPGSYKASPQEE